jgi:serine/threonine-protein kinase RsbW
MELEKPIVESYIQVNSDLSALTRIWQWFEGTLKLLITEQSCWECEVAITEGFTNAVLHAHKNLPKQTPIELEVKLFRHALEIRIWDCGQPFDLSAQLKYLHQKNVQPLEREHEMGLLFIEKLTDDMKYVRLKNDRNCLVMRKRI